MATAVGSAQDLGHCVVVCCASAYPEQFEGWLPGHTEGVVELPPGTHVIRLAEVEEDRGWAPIAYCGVAGGGHAALAWVHPQVLQRAPPCVGEVTVGHLRPRGWAPPSHAFPPGPTGVHWWEGALYLNARWPWRATRPHTLCTGMCISISSELCSSPEVVGAVLEFARHGRSGVVACNRGKHRSVACAHALALLFGRRVDWQWASTRRRCDCEGIATAHTIAAAMRALPRELRPPLLSDALWRRRAVRTADVPPAQRQDRGRGQYWAFSPGATDALWPYANGAPTTSQGTADVPQPRAGSALTASGEVRWAPPGN